MDEAIERAIRERRIGMFLVANTLLDLGARVTGPLLDRCVVLRRRVDPGSGTTRFVAYSPAFEPLPVGEEPPLYIPHVSRGAVGDVSVEWSRAG